MGIPSLRTADIQDIIDEHYHYVYHEPFIWKYLRILFEHGWGPIRRAKRIGDPMKNYLMVLHERDYAKYLMVNAIERMKDKHMHNIPHVTGMPGHRNPPPPPKPKSRVTGETLIIPHVPVERLQTIEI